MPAALPIVAHTDDDRIELAADREIVLRCGKASITLTSAGKVIISGAYLLSRSSGVNRPCQVLKPRSLRPRACGE